MSQKINPREVLSYLNELGYVNITAQQLKEFIKDLKKIIKYEHRCENTQKEVSTSSSCSEPRRNNISTPESHKESEQQHDIFQMLHNRDTVASKARSEGRSGRQISVHITKGIDLRKVHDHCIHIKENIRNELNKDESEPQENKHIKTDCPKDDVLKIENSNVMSLRPNSKGSTSSALTKSKKSKSSVIKIRSTKPVNKCDPVALYHQYQEEWKKIKFPGQDHHSDLRWAVREKLLSGPSVQVPLRRSSSKRKCDYK